MQATLRVLILFNIANCCLHLVCAQNIPRIACPNYFQYLTYNNQYVGKITLPNVAQGSIKLDVYLSQREPIGNYYGKLSLYEDKDTTIQNIQRGQPISYRVDFPFPNVLPKLTRIAVNDFILCSDSDYPPPSSMARLQHTLRTSTTTIPLQNDYFPFDSFPNTVESEPATTFTYRIQPDGTVVTQSTTRRQSVNRQSTIKRPAIIRQTTPPPPVVYEPPPQVQPQPQPRPRPRPRPQTETPSVIGNRQLDNPNAACGREGSNVTPFIHGGIVLTRGQFPWLTAIYKKETAGLKFICGGSLVSARTVVTAAHCFKLTSLKAENVVVYLGRYNLTSYTESGFEAREITQLITHPQYNANSFSDADVAILQLEEPVSFTRYINPICLWNESDDVNIILGQTAYVAGWGADENGRDVSPVPKMVDANVVSETECRNSLDVFKTLASPRTLCAGNRDGTGPCMGDSGGGLMINRSGRWMLRGVVSAGQTTRRQCNLREYVIYCDLAKHINWVRDNIF